MNAADRGMGLGLRALNRLAGLELIDRIGMRERAERMLFRATKNGFRAVERENPWLDTPSHRPVFPQT